jgi:hypothetical protein
LKFGSHGAVENQRRMSLQQSQETASGHSRALRRISLVSVRIGCVLR